MTALALLALAGCAGLRGPNAETGVRGPNAEAGTAEPAGTPAADQPCDSAARRRDHLILWHPFVDDDIHRQSFTAGLDAYRIAHPGTTVEAHAYPVESLAARLGMASADDAPDAILVSDDDLPRLADSGRTRPAQECLAAVGGPAPDRFWPASRRAWTARGQLWAVPYAATVPLLWFDQRRLAAAGLDVPRTRGELGTALARLRQMTGRAAMRYDQELAFILADRWSRQRGHPLVDRDAAGRAHVHLDTPGVRADLLWLRDLDRAGLVASTGSDASADDLLALMEPDGPALAVQSSAAAGPALRMIEDGRLDPRSGGLAALPRPGPAPAAEPPVSGYGFVLVSGNGHDARTATALAAFLADPARQADLAAVAGFMPTVRGAEAEPALVEAVRRNPPLQVPLDLVTTTAEPVADGGEAVHPGTWNEVRTTVIDAYRRLEDGDDAGAVMAQAQAIATRHVELYETAHTR
jgi:ABC-type glycerol-3-phosphate transport system substrate-binding protein